MSALEVIELEAPLVRGGGMRWQVRGDLRERGEQANLEAAEAASRLFPAAILKCSEEQFCATLGSREGAEVLVQRLS